MSSMQNVLKAALHNHVFRTQSMAKYASLWLALYTVKPDKDGAGGTEVSTTDTGYGRVQCGPLDANWDVPDSNGRSVSLVDFSYQQPTGAWGTVVFWGICDAETGGNILVVEDLLVPKPVTDQDLPPKFAAGDLAFTWS